MSVTFTAPGAPGVNVTNDHAARLLDLLGLPFGDGTGQCPANDFAGRVLLAQALLDAATADEYGTPDTAIDAYARADDDYAAISAPARTGRWVECGTAPGYLAARLADLAELADQARARKTPVRWS